MISYNEAKSKILKEAKHLPFQKIPLEDSIGLILASDIYSPIDLPPFDNSQMDGFALKAACLSDSLKKLRISQTIKAGDSPSSLKEGTCARIMTGAPLPDGADVVVPIEDAIVDKDFVTFKSDIKRGQFVRYKGEDIKNGDVIAKKGTRISPRLTALMAALGLANTTTYSKPRIMVITTGDEFQESGKPLKPGKIYDSNKIALTSAIQEIGIKPASISIGDNIEAMTSTIKKALQDSDILITSGGVSVGDYDYIKSSLESIGVKIEFWRVTIKPGKPLLFGTFEGKFIFGLPGNPVSSMITFELFAKPFILKMMGHDKTEPPRKTAIAGETINGGVKRTDLLRGIARQIDGKIMVNLSGKQGSHMFKSLADSNCIIVIPEDKDIIEAGEEVEIYAL